MIIKKFRDVDFVNRENEIEFFKNYFKLKPERILWVYGPKSTGKTTLIEYIIEKELTKGLKVFDKYWIKYINFRGLLVTNYDNFVESFLEEAEDKEDDFRGEVGSSFNLGVIKLEAKLFQSIKQKKKNLFNELINRLEKIKKRKIIIIDEIQTLEDIYLNGDKLLLNEFLNFCVRLTKETHLSHIVILTSNTIFLNQIYTNSKLKVTSEFKLIDHLKYNDIKEWLKQKRFTQEEIDLIFDYLGGSTPLIKKLLDNYKYYNSLQEYLDSEVEMTKNEVLYTLKRVEDKEVKKSFKLIIKDILNKGYFEDDSEDNRFLKTIDIFCEQEILFFDPVLNKVTANNRIYKKAFEKLLYL